MEKDALADSRTPAREKSRRAGAGINENLSVDFIWPDNFGSRKNDPTPLHSASSKPPHSISKKADSSRSKLSIERKRLILEKEKKKQELERRQRQIQFEEKEIENNIRLLELEHDLQEAELDAQDEIGSNSEERVDLLPNLSSSDNEKQKSVAKWVNEIQDEPEHIHRNDMKLICETFSNAIKSVAIPTQNNKLLARHAVEKDFPFYDGNPQEWPLFYKQYQNICRLCEFSNEEIMLKLQKCLRGDAKSAVAGMMLTADNVDLVIQTLEMRFGRPEFIIDGLISRVRGLPFLKDSNFERLIQFSGEVNNMVSIMKTLKSRRHLQNPQLLKDLLRKLPDHLKLKWGEKMAICEDESDLEGFSKWVGDIARAACYVSTPFHTSSDKFVPKSDNRKPERVFNILEKVGDRRCSYCDQKAHDDDCPLMKRDDIEKRWNTVTSRKLCFSCLKKNHQKFKCRTRKQCGIDECKLFHHRLLHKEDLGLNNQQNNQGSENVCTVRTNSKRVLLRVIPVELYGPRGSLQVLALCDEASTVTLLDEEIAKKLGLNGIQETLCLQWTNEDTSIRLDSLKTNLKISKVNDQQFFIMKGIRTVNNLSLPAQTVKMTEWRKMSHLRNLPIRDIYDEKPVLLIGQDNIDIIVARQIRSGPENSPIASRCKLGWAIHGPSQQNEAYEDVFKPHRTMHICDQEEPEDDLQEMIKKSYSTENFGVLVTRDRLSRENTRAVKTMEDTIRKVDERYEIGLLWKSDNTRLPHSKITAMQRLYCTERKCQRNIELGREYCQKIKIYEEKNYIRKLSPEEAKVESSRTWYLPHFAVSNPNKRKIRLVFDAAARSNGVSLNDTLSAGPDLLQSLVAILWKFRQYRFGFCGDVKEMFHQVRIRKEDREAQRFLWRNLEYDKNPDVYEMLVMTFGATCSPVCAQFVKNYHAERNVSDPYVKDAILKKFYVDDYLDSRATEGEARDTIIAICDAMKSAGFEVVNWLTNSKLIQRDAPENMLAEKNIDDGSSLHRVLGLWWDTQNDQFQFKVNIKADISTATVTKRKVLKTVMSLYDPLGLISTFTIKAKIFMQEVWRTGIDWDENLNENLLKTWKTLMTELPKISTIRIPRCYSLNIPTATKIELHTFCDSSEKAFAAVSFLRVVEATDEVDLSLVSSKARVAPLKPLSIPRLELQGAVMASRLAQSIKTELEIPIHQLFFWSDSRCVLSWIKGDGRQFKQFVSHRIGEIQERTNPEDWRWVPTSLNPADEATRPHFDQNKKIIPDSWIHGPEFLKKCESFWPKEDCDIVMKDLDETEKKTEYGVCLILSEKKMPLPDIRRFSRYLKLIRSTAWCQRFLKKLLCRQNRPLFENELSVEELEEAENLWVKQCQYESFHDELSSLKNGKDIGKRSRLRSLNPELNSGIIVLRGRTNLARFLSDKTKEPIILDPKHDFTKLLVRHYHERFRHSGMELVLNELRQKYWVINGRSAVKSAFAKCQYCKNQRAKPIPQLMGQLPKERLNREVRPFANIGMDYFGPIQIKIGRRREKRWGVIFTCLSIRAIHLEVAHSLNCESAVMAILRMIARRGQPKVICCDNGTNLVAADKEIKKALQDLDTSAIVDKMTSRGIQFKFNAPGAPNMGGAWERLIGSVKRIISKDLHNQSLREETLQTFFAQAEHIVNSRPLTRVSGDPMDLEALTPNHFLLGSATGDGSLIRLDPDSNCLRREWKKSQMLLEHFWSRWVKEYLPTLTKRSKWTKNQQPIRINDVVILVDSILPRYSWKLGIITAVYPGPDGRIRVVDVKTSTAEYRRPITKICRLDLEQN